MSYRRALAFGWKVLWGVFEWSLVLSLPTLLAFIVFRGPMGSVRVRELGAVLMPLVWVLFVLPLSIKAAVLDVYSDLRVSVTRPADRGDGLTYFESLQVSLLVFVIHGGLLWLLYWLHLPNRLGAAGYSLWFPFLVLVIYPAIAAAVIRIPFLGFRISIVPTLSPNAVPASQGE